MTDASPTGGALVIADATVEEVMAEAALASPTGWLLGEELEDSDSEEEATSAVPRAVSMKFYRFLHLFSGAEHSESLSHHIKLICGSKGIIAVVDVADLETEPYINLLCRTTVEELKSRARAGFWDGGHGGPPCSTFSPALSKPPPGGGGPKPYRSRMSCFFLVYPTSRASGWKGFNMQTMAYRHRWTSSWKSDCLEEVPRRNTPEIQELPIRAAG